MDDQSDDERKLAGSMLLTRARYEAVNTKAPIIVQGDFNRCVISSSTRRLFEIVLKVRSPPTGDDSGAYKIITGAQTPVAINSTFAEKYAVGNEHLNFTMIDLRAEAPRRSVSNTFATFTGFTSPGDSSNWDRIDFIFGGSNEGW